MTDCPTKTPSTWRLRLAGWTPPAGAPGTWPIGGSLPSSFLDHRPQKDILSFPFLLLFSLGFLISNVPYTQLPHPPHSEGRDHLTGRAKGKTNFFWNQSERAPVVPASRLCKWQELPFTPNRKESLRKLLRFSRAMMQVFLLPTCFAPLLSANS